MVFKSTFGSSRFNLALLISKLKDIEEVIKQNNLRMAVGEKLPRSLKKVENEKRLIKF